MLGRAKTEPLHLPVTPDPAAAAQIERQVAAITFKPHRGFLKDQPKKDRKP